MLTTQAVHAQLLATSHEQPWALFPTYLQTSLCEKL